MEKKTCTQCVEEKFVTEFYSEKRLSDGLRSACKTCVKQKIRDRYNNDPAFRKQKGVNTKNSKQLKQIKILTILKRTGCKDCGETDPIVLDFDHQKDKVAGISIMIRNHYSWADIELEIAKCEVRCANCHRKKTAIERNYYSTIDLDSL